MTRSRRSLMLGCALSVALVGGVPASEEAKSALSPRHRQLLLAAGELAHTVRERVWPGWNVEMELLLVTEDSEVLIGGSRRPPGFEKTIPDPDLGALKTRPRVFPPSLLATMPVFGPPATIVAGGPETTDRNSSQWLQVLLHEHFHQWQMRRPSYFAATTALDLAGGDTTGRWMLEYPFPYDAPELGKASSDLGVRLATLLRRPAEVDVEPEAAEFWQAFGRLERSLEPADRRYLNFQLWQEGVARFVELRVAEEAAAGWSPPPEMRSGPDFEDFGALACAAWESLLDELVALDLEGDRRVVFYSLGAGMALLLDRTEPDWKSRYETPRFALAPRLPAD